VAEAVSHLRAWPLLVPGLKPATWAQVGSTNVSHPQIFAPLYGYVGPCWESNPVHEPGKERAHNYGISQSRSGDTNKNIYIATHFVMVGSKALSDYYK